MKKEDKFEELLKKHLRNRLNIIDTQIPFYELAEIFEFEYDTQGNDNNILSVWAGPPGWYNITTYYTDGETGSGMAHVVETWNKTEYERSEDIFYDYVYLDSIFGDFRIVFLKHETKELRSIEVNGDKDDFQTSYFEYGREG